MKFIVLCNSSSGMPKIEASTDTEESAMAKAEQATMEHGKPHFVYKRIHVCSPVNSVKWEGSE